MNLTTMIFGFDFLKLYAQLDKLSETYSNTVDELNKAKLLVNKLQKEHFPLY